MVLVVCAGPIKEEIEMRTTFFQFRTKSIGIQILEQLPQLAIDFGQVVVLAH